MFFKTFRKSRYSYTTIERKRDADRTQSYVMKILGKDSKSEKIIANVTQRFQNGDETALLGISTSTNDDPNTLVINTDFLKRFHDGINDIRNSRETDPTRLINAMYVLGISLDNEHLLTEGQLTRNKGELKEKMLNQLVKIDNLLKNRRGKISIEEYVNNIKDLSKLVGFTMDETNDISVHDMSTGKTFQRYSEPSFIHDTIDDLADETTGESLLTSLESKYVRFPQFGRNSNGQRIFLCSWLNDIKKNGHLRKYLKVHSNTSTDKKAFTKQSDKQYLLSMIKAFFAPQEMYNSFEGQYDKNVALFRVLLYSDKNSQEFVQFRPTGDAYIDLNDKAYDSQFYKQFVGHAKEYLYFELNRMNSVYHQLKEGDHENDVQNYNISSKDGAAIKEKIAFGKITQKNKQTGQIELASFIQKSGLCFKYFSYLNGELANKNSKFGQNVIKYLNGDKTVKEAIVSDFEKLFKQNMESGFNEFMEYVQKIFPKNQLGSVTQVFNGKTSNQIERLMRWFYFNDNLAAMNICNLTVIDPAFSKDTIDFQKRYAQVHSQTQRLDKDAEFQIDDNPRNTKPYSKDGKFRFVIIDDQIVSSQLKHAVEKVFADLMDKAKKAAEKRGVNPQDDLEYIKYKTLHDTIPAMFDKSTGDGVNVTDGQAYNSPTSLWKKMGMLGQVDDEFRRAYDAIRSGDMGLGNFKIVLQSLKPFVYGMSEQFEDGVIRSAANTKLVPIQLKDSESLLFLAGAILEGANKLQRSSKQNPLLALYNFMEESHFGKGNEHTLENYNGIGIDSVVFKSCVKVGASGVLNIAGKTYDEVMEELEKCYVDGEYNKTYVHELDYDAYGIQQNVPQHMQDHEQPLGSQERIISMTDIPDDFKCTIDGVDYTKESIIHEYADLIAKDYNGGIHSLMKKFGAVKDNKTGLYVINRSKFNLYLSKLLTEKIANDSKYSQELYHAFTSLINKNVGDGKKGYEFIAPIGDPAISEIVYGVLFTEIKHAINEQNVPGGPVVQMSNFGLNSDLHITDSDGKVVSVDKNGKIGGLDYKKGLVFEAYVTCPTAEFEQKITKPDGMLMTMNEIEGLVKKGELSSEELNFIAYRIPTEDKYSIFRCKIKGFIPRQQGELIILPSEITLLSGTDFDIDKMYCWFKNGKNKIEKIKDTDEKARAARRDRMFDIQWAVMGHESSVEKQLNPGGYDVLKKLAGDVNPEYKSGSKDIFTVKTQVDMRKLNAAGKQFVGIAALNNVCHGMMSFCHVKINSLPAFEIQFNTPNGESKTVNSHDLVDSNSEFEMDSVTSQFDKSRISRTLSMFVGAAADNAKEALLGALNITPVTANYAMSFIRMGFPIQVVVYMMNNPLIKRLSDQAEIEGKRFEKVIMENYHSYPRPVNTYTISENELIGRIKSGDEEVKPIDVAVLDLLAESTQICSELSSINQLMSLNSMKNTIGPSLADALNKRMQLESLVDNIKSGDSVFAEDTYDKITQSLPFINPLMKCYTSVIDKLCETFSPVFTNEFMTILKSLHKKGFYIDKKNLKSLMSGYFIYNAKMLGLFGDFGQTQKLDLNESDEKFSVRKRMALLNDFPNTLLRKKSKYGKNEFIRSLYFEDMTKSMKIPAVKYNNAGSSRSWSDDMSASWAELVQTTDVGLLNLNKMLFEYMSTRYGFFWGPYSPVSITPMLAKLRIQNKEAGTKYSDIFDPLKQNGFRDILMMSCFMDQFSRNNPKCGLWKDVAVMYDKRGPYIKYSDYSENQFGYSSDRYKNLFRPIRESMFQGEDGIMYIRLSEVERLGIDNNFMEYEPGMVNLKTVVDVQNFSGIDFSEEDEDYETEDTTEDENEYMNPTFGFEDNDELDVLPEQRLNDLAESLSGIFKRHGLNVNVNAKGKILTRIEIKEKLEDMLNTAVRTERISQSAANDIKNESNKEIDKPC